MDKNTVTGFILIALVVIGFTWYSQPSKEELEAMAKQDSIAAVKTPSNSPIEGEKKDTLMPSVKVDSSSLFSPFMRESEGSRVSLHNNKVKIGISS